MIVDSVTVETQLTGPIRAKLGGEPSGFARFAMRLLKPRFIVHTIAGDYELEPYGRPDAQLRAILSVAILAAGLWLIKRK